MRLNQIDLNLFLILDAVYQQRNLTRAADVLCITQPAVSNALGRLRRALDDPLFVRTSEGMVPTPFVETIVGRVQDALHQIDTCVSQEKQFDARVAKKVYRFSMNDLCEAVALPGLLSALGEDAPGIRLECYQLGRKEAARELASGSLDFALDVPLMSSPGLSSVALARQDYVCVVRPDHPVLRTGLTLEDYLGMEHILVSSRRKGRGYEDTALARLSHQRSIRLRVQHFQVATMLVAKTDMALTIPASLAEDYDLASFELPFSLAPVEWCLYWHKSVDEDAASQWMRGVVARSFN